MKTIRKVAYVILMVLTGFLLGTVTAIVAIGIWFIDLSAEPK